MPHSHVPHFEEPGRMNPKSIQEQMPVREYAMALDVLVLTCVDVALVHGDRILLARRNQYPRKSWWILGGRMAAGESPIETAQRKVAEEAHLTHLSPERFHYIGAYSTCFAQRAQAPIHHGSHSVNLTYRIELTDQEQAAVILTRSEYESECHWIEIAAVPAFLTDKDPLDQALLQVVQDIHSSLSR